MKMPPLIGIFFASLVLAGCAPMSPQTQAAIQVVEQGAPASSEVRSAQLRKQLNERIKDFREAQESFEEDRVGLLIAAINLLALRTQEGIGTDNAIINSAFDDAENFLAEVKRDGKRERTRYLASEQRQ